MYDTREDATQRLGSTVVMFQEKPTFVVEGVGTKGKVNLRHILIRDNKEMSNPITDKSWDFKNLGSRLGYMNTKYMLDAEGKEAFKEALFLRRVAVRQSHSTQGLSQKNLRYKNLNGSEALGIPSRNIDFNQLYKAPSFCDTLEGNYPSFQEIQDAFSKDPLVSSLAFHRAFAVRAHTIVPFYLEYKGKDIGYTEDFYRWKVADQFKYLSETLENDLNLNLKIA